MPAKDDGQGKWITIGGAEGDDGKRHGGSPVFVQNGRITKGSPSLTGKKIDALKDAPEESSHRRDLNREKDYTRAIWGKKAREAGHKPEHLHALADDLMRHDREHVEHRKRLLRDARETLKRDGYDPRALTTNLRSGRVEDAIPHLDELVEEMQHRYPDQFNGHHDAEARMLDLLTEGNPEPMDHYSAYQQALDHLLEHGAPRDSLEPWDDDEEPIPFSRIGTGENPMPSNDAAMQLVSEIEEKLHQLREQLGGTNAHDIDMLPSADDRTVMQQQRQQQAIAYRREGRNVDPKDIYLAREVNMAGVLMGRDSSLTFAHAIAKVRNGR